MLKNKQDAFGQALYDFHKGGRPRVAFERHDGYIDCSENMAHYFARYRDWPGDEKMAMRFVKGRVLDIGCGPGRHAVHLQERGYDVVGIDNSRLAVKVCRLRGLRRAKVMSATQVSSGRIHVLGGRFDTVLMLGNNFGLFGSFTRAKWMLRRFRGVTNPDARILTSTLDPYDTDRPEHLAYHRYNRRLGRMGGQVRIRARYRWFASPWFDYLFVSRAELRQILDGTGWELRKTLDGPDNRYIAIIQRR